MKKLVTAFFIASLLLFSNFHFSLAVDTPYDVLCTASGGKQGINTAIGCIPYEDHGALIVFLVRWAIGIAGGIALFLILLAGFQITTSAGDPKRLQAGQELLTSAIAGLLLLIFSTFVLRIIGVNILGIF